MATELQTAINYLKPYGIGNIFVNYDHINGTEASNAVNILITKVKDKYRGSFFSNLKYFLYYLGSYYSKKGKDYDDDYAIIKSQYDALNTNATEVKNEKARTVGDLEWNSFLDPVDKSTYDVETVSYPPTFTEKITLYRLAAEGTSEAEMTAYDNILASFLQGQDIDYAKCEKFMNDIDAYRNAQGRFNANKIKSLKQAIVFCSRKSKDGKLKNDQKFPKRPFYKKYQEILDDLGSPGSKTKKYYINFSTDNTTDQTG